MFRRFPRPKRQWAAAGLFALAVFVGCSAKKNYKTLSFFFDGVPDPNAPQGFSSRRGSNLKPVFIHKPYAEEKCDSCHLNTDDIFARAKVRENVCMECHAAVMTKFAVMHGPVGAGACLQCHSPHSSSVEHLLKVPAPGLCTRCHEPADLSTKVAQHTQPKIDCLSCHSGHGGNDRRFLKFAGGPTTAPSSASPAKGGAT
jgi:predicted CXXCH cytochrome family protein